MLAFARPSNKRCTRRPLVRSRAAAGERWQRTFADFDDYWTTILGGPSVGPKLAKDLMFRRITLALVMILGVTLPAAAQDLVAKGRKLFTDQRCTLCHSVNGRGNVKGAMDGAGSMMTADEVRAWLTDAKGMTAKTKATRKPDMKQYTLEKEDVDALVAYVLSLKRK